MNAPTLSFLGRYRLVKVLGQGAMGVVYEAEDARLGRTVAIKTVLRSHMMEETTAVEFSRRFEREAQAAARLSHPNIVTVYDFGEHEDVAYIVMEFVRGRELGQIFAAGEKFTLHETVRIMGELLAALDVAHRQGVVHRDVKPANVLIDGAGHVKLTDFGVARVTAAGQNRTMPGTLVGTPSYMSPEQILGMPVGSRADIFAAGVILYQFLTGQRPFIGGGPFAVQRKIVQDPAPPPSQIKPAVPPAFDAIVERALAKQPEQRYESAAAFAADLERALVGVPAPAPALDIDLPERTLAPPTPAAAAEPSTVAPYSLASTLPPTRPPRAPAVPPPAAVQIAIPVPAPAPPLAPPARPAAATAPDVDRTTASGEGALRKQPAAEPSATPHDPDATVILLRTSVPGTLPPTPTPTATPPRPVAAQAPLPAAPAPPMARPAPAQAIAPPAQALPVASQGTRMTPPQRAAAAAGGVPATGTPTPTRSNRVRMPVEPATARRPPTPPPFKRGIKVPLLAGAGVAVLALVVLLAVTRPWSGAASPKPPASVGMPAPTAPPATAANLRSTPAPGAATPTARADGPSVVVPNNENSAQTSPSRLPPAGAVTTPPAADAARFPAVTSAPPPSAAPTPPPAIAPSPAPAPKPALAPAPEPAPTARRTYPDAARTPAPTRPEAQPSGVTARCNDLLHRMQLGEPLSAEQTEFFQSRCTR